ncbi:hypothetical protein EUBVEN_01904 [Eubacterium ventriosum ATCC 27560]|uniref:Uncharacterized protein n=1 Tax=Eubacterium ventriosum ATCC 27560 TaxID=411463 RepID=A5Z865_9FIRM|nr:hypothetical protein EUBVEN_01904 [Eubacterium ventriosum ATCC 27560]
MSVAFLNTIVKHGNNIIYHLFLIVHNATSL